MLRVVLFLLLTVDAIGVKPPGPHYDAWPIKPQRRPTSDSGGGGHLSRSLLQRANFRCASVLQSAIIMVRSGYQTQLDLLYSLLCMLVALVAIAELKSASNRALEYSSDVSVIDISMARPVPSFD